MANVVRKVYRYLSASANRKFDEKADVRVQIDQAIEESRRQHEVLRQQAARVIGNQRQLEMRMARQIENVTMLTDSARSALTFADNARADGERAAADQYEQTARAFASELVAAESSLEDMRALHQQAVESSELARRAVDDNTERLRQQLAERARLLTQIEHAAMREQMSKAMDSMSDLTPAGDTPTLAEIREKVEQRYAVAMGRHELASSGVEARMLEVRRASIDARASNRLAELRAGMTAGAGAEGGASGQPAGQVPAGADRVALGKTAPPPSPGAHQARGAGSVNAAGPDQ
ncbi:PspA/IM30 family protein [Frankia nepalensis]|uniref:PspA/IM30 family protein n=2 Tax=Frankia nepalensis TaxID=1836974 RepID=A0A937RGL1_9ACTN|nr:PspA/IM30 family protein [Frankia nepalensis]MBL7501325.1 PspA/IM30 family protein [Frankia nepalensis]MBL7510825.1 PspA/IM30 family protein [Frankia nepalensis]MBL7628600.1 PspA/IM30 family protein [Frankia nepalensis]